MKFRECGTTEGLLQFFDNDELAFRHTNYYHYTSLESADSIFNTKQLRLMPLCESANDEVEKNNYRKLESNLFSLCFSTGTSESLPLWYLYSGIDGCGVRLGLKKKTFRRMIEQAHLFLLELELAPAPNRSYGVRSKTELQRGDYKLLCRDILYIGRDSQKANSYRAKYNGDVLNDISTDIADRLQDKYGRFTKGLIWFYEKETRIQVEITNPKLLLPEKRYAVAISLDDIYADISLRFAPECNKTEPDELSKYEGIVKYAFAKLEKSEYTGQVKMKLKDRLCRDCVSKNN